MDDALYRIAALVSTKEPSAIVPVLRDAVAEHVWLTHLYSLSNFTASLVQVPQLSLRFEQPNGSADRQVETPDMLTGHWNVNRCITVSEDVRR